MIINEVNKHRAVEIGNALIWAAELATKKNVSMSVLYMDEYDMAIPVETSDCEEQYGWEVVATVT
jgi:hypothetical protein